MLSQMRPAMLGEGHIRMFGTLEIGHLVHPGVQRLQCYPWAEMRYFGFNREDFVFVRPPGVQSFVLSPNNVWYGRLKLLFRITVKVDGKEILSIWTVLLSPFAMKSNWRFQVFSNLWYLQIM